MPRTIFCLKLNQTAEGLDFPPYPGALGEKIFQHISKSAWQSWLNHQVILINEYRLNLLDKQAKDFLVQEMEKFLFSDEAKLPENYQPI